MTALVELQHYFLKFLEFKQCYLLENSDFFKVPMMIHLLFPLNWQFQCYIIFFPPLSLSNATLLTNSKFVFDWTTIIISLEENFKDQCSAYLRSRLLRILATTSEFLWINWIYKSQMSSRYSFYLNNVQKPL